MDETKSLFVGIMGLPNVGKSTLLNRLIGWKAAIVSPKPQTTRTDIKGVLTKDSVQIVFTDTPGFHTPRNKLGENMIKAVGRGIGDVDVCALVTDCFENIKDGERELISRFKKEKTPALLVINKIDKLSDKTKIIEKISSFSKLYDWEAVVPVSAKTGDGVNYLLDELFSLAEPSPHFYPDDALTDQSERMIASELIREKILRLTDKEIPHGVAVEIEKFRLREDKDIIDIDAVIYCEKESHKGIIIGKSGSMLKRIAQRAREDLEKSLGNKVNLKVYVKVKENWRDKENLLRDFGLSDNL